MGIAIKRKAAEPVASPPPAPVKRVIKLGGVKPGIPVVEQNQEVSNEDVLALVGLSSAPSSYKTASDKVKALKDHWPALSVGDEVVVTNELYPWVDRWKPGDVGVVVRYSAPVPEARVEGNKWAVVSVKLKHPRKEGHETCIFHRWELREVSA